MKNSLGVTTFGAAFLVSSCAQNSGQSNTRAATQLGAQQRPPIIDMHMHARNSLPRYDGPGQISRLLCFPEPCERPATVAQKDEDILKMTVESMKRYNIVLGFLSDPLDRVYKWVDAAPGRFWASPMISDPARVDLSALRKEYEAGRLRGMGELTNQYAGIPANDPRMEPVFALAEEKDVPVLIHSEGIAGGSQRFRIAYGHPELLEDVLVKHPRIRLYLENAAFPFLDETVSLMYRYPNIYADMSTITWIIPRGMFYRYLHGLIDAGLGKRLMFGSDQMEWPETIGLAIEAVQSADFLTTEQKRDILYNNAARFLRLSQEEIAKHHRN